MKPLFWRVITPTGYLDFTSRPRMRGFLMIQRAQRIPFKVEHHFEGSPDPARTVH